MPAGLQHAGGMHRFITATITLLAALAACRNDGSCRPAPDPDPEPADTIPVGGDNPSRPVEQPKPAPSKTPP